MVPIVDFASIIASINSIVLRPGLFHPYTPFHDLLSLFMWCVKAGHV